MLYDSERGKIFCTVCTKAVEGKLLLPQDSNSTASKQAFVKEGFSCWKNATLRLTNHESSSFHQQAFSGLKDSQAKQTVVDHLSIAKRKEMNSNRKALMKIFDTIKTVARQGLALRGDWNDEDGNFIQILKMRAQDVPELDNWLKRDSYSWLSHQIVDEILQIMSDSVLRQMVNEIKHSEFYAIIADETSDVASLEQVSVNFRIVNDILEAKELFVGFYQVNDIKATTLFKVIGDIFKRFGLDYHKLVGQNYDGAANMSGEFQGLQALVMKEAPLALYLHCVAHSTNLVAQDAMEDVTCARNLIQMGREIINFIRDSPNRLGQFKNLKEDSSAGLIKFAPTR